MTAFLASVRSLSEAKLAYAVGADWIDLKEPGAGALGAVEPETIKEVMGWLGARNSDVPVSATIGDCWNSPGEMPDRVRALSSLGVAFAKIGIFAAAPTSSLLRTIEICCREGPAIILVCFAEESPSARDLAVYANTGIAGLMLDTSTKGSRGLRGLVCNEDLEVFTRETNQLGLICGLAGSLKLDDIDDLCRLEPDYLGFRGALCENGSRESSFSQAAAAAVRSRITLACGTASAAAGRVDEPENTTPV